MKAQALRRLAEESIQDSQEAGACGRRTCLQRMRMITSYDSHHLRMVMMMMMMMMRMRMRMRMRMKMRMPEVKLGGYRMMLSSNYFGSVTEEGSLDKCCA